MRILARERERKGKEAEERKRLEAQGVDPAQAALEAQQKHASRPRASNETGSSALLSAAEHEIQTKLAQGKRLSGMSNIVGSASLPGVDKRSSAPASKRLRRDTSILEHNTTQLQRPGEQSKLESSRRSEPLSSLEKHVVGCASRYRIILESAWWQPQSYAV